MAQGMLHDWIEPQTAETPPAELRAAVGGHPLVAQILAQRGICDAASARAFLDPDAYTPAPPEDLPGMEVACERIERAVRDGETICVWGDYDVDGQTATALLVEALRGLGADVIYHIPVRARESHGVNWENLEPLLAKGASLVLTCDTGIASHEALDQARKRGADVVITDHHNLPETLPTANAVVTPRLLPPGHPLAGLPGVGVAYKLAEALYRRARRAAEVEDYLDLAALGIVADVAEQTADTRYLLQCGLQALRQTKRAGLQSMYELASLQPAWITEEHIGFVIGPRLNALGRLDDANPAVEFLTTTDPGRAKALAVHLEGLNARRRLLTAQVLEGALAQIEKDPSLLEYAALVLAQPHWPAGVVGIVASELAERFSRPVVLLSAPPGQPARGSARSIEGVNITAGIASQRDLLIGFGGHPMAAGLSLDPEKINAFRRGLSRYVEKVVGETAARPTLRIDGELKLDELSLDLVSDLEQLAPFGSGNPPLVFAVRGLTILNSSTIGRDGDHLQIIVKDSAEHAQKVIWWRGAGWPLPEGIFDLACTVRASSYRGAREVQVEWIDARPVSQQPVELRRTRSVIDQRGIDLPLQALRNFLNDDPEVLVWAEADAREKLAAAGINSRDRTGLVPANTLAIWSSPPGMAELQAAVETARPSTIILFAIDPADAAVEDFLRRLAGLVKFAIAKRGGQASLARLAAAAGQRESAVRLGLRWLEERGLVQVASLSEDGQIQLAQGSGTPAYVGETLKQLTQLIEETAAFRRFLKTTRKEEIQFL